MVLNISYRHKIDVSAHNTMPKSSKTNKQITIQELESLSYPNQLEDVTWGMSWPLLSIECLIDDLGGGGFEQFLGMARSWEDRAIPGSTCMQSTLNLHFTYYKPSTTIKKQDWRLRAFTERNPRLHKQVDTHMAQDNLCFCLSSKDTLCVPDNP